MAVAVWPWEENFAPSSTVPGKSKPAVPLTARRPKEGRGGRGRRPSPPVGAPREVSFRTEMYGLVTRVMVQRGWTRVPRTGEGGLDDDDEDSYHRRYLEDGSRNRRWDVHWTGVKAAVATLRFAKRLRPGQKVNHFRNSKELCRKDLLVKNLHRMRLKDPENNSFFPETFCLPREYAMFSNSFREREGLWIVKPSGSSEGRGIFVLQSLSEAKDFRDRFLKQPRALLPASHIVQRYVERPYLIGGKKFDLRLYALVTSIKPLTIYIYRNGFARFAGCRYSIDEECLTDNSCHLTNVAVQRRRGGKLNLKSIKLLLIARHGQAVVDSLFWRIHHLIIRSILAVQDRIVHDAAAFELFGYDVLIDENLQPWLIEVNATPSLGASSEEDHRLKSQLVADVLDIVDVEGVQQRNAVPSRMGGFDLAYYGGFVERQPEDSGGWSTWLGAHQKNRLRRCRRRARSSSSTTRPTSCAAAMSYYTFPVPDHAENAALPFPDEGVIIPDGDHYAGNAVFMDHVEKHPSSYWGGLSQVAVDYPDDCKWRPSKLVCPSTKFAAG